MNDMLGVVLAGGLSRRMEGPEKSLLKLGEVPLIKRVTDRLVQQVSSIVVNANGNPERFEFLHKPVIQDTVEGFAGPLAGVLAGMRWARENTDASHILTVAADTPFFPMNYAAIISEVAMEENARIALSFSNGRRHPVFGLWPVDLADELETFLVDEGERKVMIFVERFPNCIAIFDGNDPDPFFNVNTPDDMRLAEEILARQEQQ
ncbi:MAG: molybdenum cofactor guanylyltransferase MobA [Pseudomonadota bacterium]